MRWAGGVGVAVPLLACAASGSYRVVMREQTGGELALDGDQAKAMEQASIAMQQHCGGPGTYSVVREGQVAVGEVTQTQGGSNTGSTYRRGMGSSSTSYGSTQTTQQLTEYHIWYQCGAAPAVVAQPAAAPAADPNAQPAADPNAQGGAAVQGGASVNVNVQGGAVVGQPQ
jgi:hypothetical protein